MHVTLHIGGVSASSIKGPGGDQQQVRKRFLDLNLFCDLKPNLNTSRRFFVFDGGIQMTLRSRPIVL